MGSADQYYVQPTAGALTPSFTNQWISYLGFGGISPEKASAGTPPPPGIRIVHVQHTLLASVRAQNRATPIVMQFPSSGNLLIGTYDSADVSAVSVHDSASNNWVVAGTALGDRYGAYAQILYAANASTSPTRKNPATRLVVDAADLCLREAQHWRARAIQSSEQDHSKGLLNHLPDCSKK